MEMPINHNEIELAVSAASSAYQRSVSSETLSGGISICSSIVSSDTSTHLGEVSSCSPLFREQLLVLLGRRLLRRSDLLPCHIGVAARLIDAIVLHQHAPDARRYSFHGDGYRRSRHSFVFIAVIPHQYRGSALLCRRERIRIPTAADARVHFGPEDPVAPEFVLPRCSRPGA